MNKPVIDGVFTNEELEYFKQSFEGIILYTKDGKPYIDYLRAKEVFEDVVGQDYSNIIVNSQFYPEFDTYYLHVRFIVERNGSRFEKDVMAAEKGIIKQNSSSIFNFHDLGKSAMKDAMKKFFCDYMGIGARDFYNAKSVYDGKDGSNNKSGESTSAEEYKCSACSVDIDADVYRFSTNWFVAKKALCRNCQDKYKKGLIK